MSSIFASDEIKTLFYKVYDNDKANLKLVSVELMKQGLGYMDILQLTIKELNIGLGEAIMLLEIPDYTG